MGRRLLTTITTLSVTIEAFTGGFMDKITILETRPSGSATPASYGTDIDRLPFELAPAYRPALQYDASVQRSGQRPSLNLSHKKGKPMKEPGLDNRHRDKTPPKAGKIQQKRGDTLNKNLPKPIPQFSPNAKLETMRTETRKTSVRGVRAAAKRRRP